MNKILSIVLIAFLLIGGCSTCNTYNGAIKKDAAVKAAWSQVENVYQRRADLIPNLVNTVKGSANFEQETLEKVMAARASATQVKINADQLTPENLQKFEQAQAAVSQGLGRLMAVAENYPDLKASANFLDLQKQLEGTENRIAVERRNYIGAVQDYNTFVRTFPNNLMTGFFNLAPKPEFQAAPGSDKAPEVKF